MSISKRIILRTALCGAQEVGKTSLMLRAIGKEVPKKYIPTIGIDSGSYKCISQNMYVTIRMWDISGDTRFAAVTPRFFRDSSFVLFCFDLSKLETFETLKEYVKKVDDMSGGKNYTRCVVGIKSDLSKLKNISNITSYCETIDANYHEVNTFIEPEVIFLMHSIAKDGVKSGIFEYEDEDFLEENIIAERNCPCM